MPKYRPAQQNKIPDLTLYDVNEFTVGNSDYSVMHSHPYNHIIYCVDGSGTVETLDKPINISKGDAVFVSSHVMHTERPVSGGTLRYKSLSFGNIDLHFPHENNEDPEQEESGIFLMHPQGSLSDTFRTAFDTMYTECEKERTYYSTVVECYFKILICEIVRHYGVTVSLQINKTEHVSYITDYIKKHIDTHFGWRVKRIAQNLSIDHSTICRIFKKETGMTIVEYKIKKQLNEAALKLINTDYPITHISFDCAFSSSAYFTKMFKREYGMTPSEYRKTNGQPSPDNNP